MRNESKCKCRSWRNISKRNYFFSHCLQKVVGDKNDLKHFEFITKKQYENINQGESYYSNTELPSLLNTLGTYFSIHFDNIYAQEQF